MLLSRTVGSSELGAGFNSRSNRNDAMSAPKKSSSGLSGRDDGDDPNFDAIERLLNTAAELMKDQPGLDKQAFEYLRRLRVRVRSAKAAQTKRFDIPVEKWLSRSDLNEDPISFTKRVFGDRLGQFSRAELKRWDASL